LLVIAGAFASCHASAPPPAQPTPRPIETTEARGGTRNEKGDAAGAQVATQPAPTQALRSAEEEAERKALHDAQDAEDEIVRKLDAAVKAHEKVDVVTHWMDELKKQIPETDALARKVFTPEVIERTPWTDLLSGSQKDRWQHPAFQSWRIEDGVMTAVGPALDAKQTAIMSIGDLEQWRDYVLDVEFVLVAGESTFHFRLGPAVNNSTLSLKVSTEFAPPFKAGISYNMTSTMLGSSWKVVFADRDHPPHEEEEVPWVIRRRGAVAVSVPPGSEIRITRMRIKALR
jgi:hypothetical protein